MIKINTILFKVANLLFIILIFGCFLAYMIPEIYAFIASPLYQYANAWDEETYLSFQGAIGASSIPGYYLLKIVVLLHHLGIAGSVQNLIFDVILVIATYILFLIVLKKIGCKSIDASIYSILIIFSSVLINHGNPHIIKILGNNINDGLNSLIVYGTEFYAPILRTPNPQLSYFLVALILAIYLKTKKSYVLLLPILFLYPFVLIPYCALLAIYCLYKYKIIKNIKTCFCANIIIFILMSFLLLILNIFFIKKSVIAQAGVYILAHNFYIPLVGILSIFLFLCLLLFEKISKKTIDLSSRCVLISLIFTMFTITNLQVISGLMLGREGVQNYGNSIIFGVFLACFFFYLKKYKILNAYIYNLVLLFIIFYCFYFLLISSGYDTNKKAYYIYLGRNLKDPTQINLIKENPLGAIILDEDLSTKIAYSQNKMIYPLFSYPYFFPFVYEKCSNYINYLEDAVSFIKNNGDDNERKFADDFLGRVLARRENYPETEKKYEDSCSSFDKQKKFYIVNIDGSNPFSYFPKQKTE